MSEAHDLDRGVKSGQIGLFVAEPLERVYREIAGLLGVALDRNLAVSVNENKNAQLEEAVNQNDKLTLNNEGLANCKGISECEAMLPTYEAILVDGISLPHLRGLKGNPLILICGPITGENPDLRLKTFAFNLGLEATRLLMDGREFTEKDVSEPILDLMLEEIREVLRREVRNYLELPPIPWGYSYAMLLTHDIDILSLKEMPIARTFLGYFYRSTVLNWKRWRDGKVLTSEFYQAIWEMVRTWAAKGGLGKDVWQRALPALIALEKRLEVRSSLYFMPFPKKPGILPERLRKSKDKDKDKDTDTDTGNTKNRDRGKDKEYDKSIESAPTNRASFYDVSKYPELISHLEDGGWETGVHGIDAWHDGQAARAEHSRVADLTGGTEIGVRMHWLYFKSPDSFKALEEGGFLYDATVGFNEVVGFRAGTLQPYHPLNCQTLWELPLHIQDGALMGEEYFNLNREDAFLKAKPILDWAKRFGGAVSLLWHNQSFTAPRFWGEVYESLVTQGRQDGAWIAIPRDVLGWFTLRRKCEATLTIVGTHWQITCAHPALRQIPTAPQIPSLPPVRVRLYLDPNRVRTVSVPYEVGKDYIDLPAQALVTLEVEGED